MSCPICGKDAKPETRPFCCKRCADVDLARWLNGNYAMPSDDPEDIEAAIEAVEQAAAAADKLH